MEAIENILTRRSIRKFKQEKVAEKQIETVLKAAMYAPSARNEQPWHFIVIDDSRLKEQIKQAHPHAKMLSDSPAAILVCGDKNLELSPDYWPVDCAAATQNILLAAHAIGLGTVWLGIHPRTERKKAIREIFGLPDNIEPFSLVAIGMPDEEKEVPERFRPDRIKRNRWEEY